MATPSLVRDLVYDEDRGLALDLHLAPEAAAAPVVLYVHGGGFEVGDRFQHADDRLPALASRGLNIASLDYRLAPEAVHPGPIEDVRRAARHLAENAAPLGIAPGALGAIGVSAGGYLAAAAALDGPRTGPGAIRAVSAWSAPFDLGTSSSRSPLEERRGVPPVFEHNLVPGLDPEGLRAVDLVHRDLRDAPPFLLLHGALDLIIAPDQSRAMHAALQAAGAESTLVELGGAGHDDPQLDEGPVLDLVAAWFRAVLA
jgi:acetyl esterase/lipase